MVSGIAVLGKVILVNRGNTERIGLLNSVCSGDSSSVHLRLLRDRNLSLRNTLSGSKRPSGS